MPPQHGEESAAGPSPAVHRRRRLAGTAAAQHSRGGVGAGNKLAAAPLQGGRGCRHRWPANSDPSRHFTPQGRAVATLSTPEALVRLPPEAAATSHAMCKALHALLKACSVVTRDKQYAVNEPVGSACQLSWQTACKCPTTSQNTTLAAAPAGTAGGAAARCRAGVRSGAAAAGWQSLSQHAAAATAAAVSAGATAARAEAATAAAGEAPPATAVPRAVDGSRLWAAAAAACHRQAADATAGVA